MIDFVHKYLLQIFIVALIGYMLGSINFSIVVTRQIKKATDIRQMGSGNAGFTNVLRSVGKTAAIVTFLGDISKSAFAIFLGRMIFMISRVDVLPQFYVYQFGAYIAGVFCVIGHIYPCFFKFKGGKGVLTLFAMIFFIDLRTFFILLGLFGILFLCTKIISLCSIVVATCYPIVTFVVGFFFDYSLGGKSSSISYVVITTTISVLMSALVIYKHKSNIKRILNGDEKKISLKR